MSQETRNDHTHTHYFEGVDLTDVAKKKPSPQVTASNLFEGVDLTNVGHKKKAPTGRRPGYGRGER